MSTATRTDADQAPIPMRYAILPLSEADAEQLRAYLPGNYALLRAQQLHTGMFVVAGRDHCGWTLDGYVIPRLASGLHSAREVERIPVVLPHSEVCVHMGIAGREAEVTLREPNYAIGVPPRTPFPTMAQVWIEDKPFSFPITLGEAGVRQS
jgi:hypothetical protein